MTSIGATLRSERLRRGLRLEQVAAATKIRLHLLEAMEYDHFDLLPRGLLARSFVRQYAHTLGLNEDEIIASFKQQCDPFSDPVPEPLHEDRSWHFPHASELLWVLAVVFACAGAYSYSFWQDRQRTSPEIVIGAKGSRPDSRLNDTPSPRNHWPKPKLRPEIVSNETTIRALPIEGRHSEPGPLQDSDVQAMRVAFTATEPVWLSIKSDGAQTYRGTLEKQQSKEFGLVRRIHG